MRSEVPENTEGLSKIIEITRRISEHFLHYNVFLGSKLEISKTFEKLWLKSPIATVSEISKQHTQLIRIFFFTSLHMGRNQIACCGGVCLLISRLVGFSLSYFNYAVHLETKYSIKGCSKWIFMTLELM